MNLLHTICGLSLLFLGCRKDPNENQLLKINDDDLLITEVNESIHGIDSIASIYLDLDGDTQYDISFNSIASPADSMSTAHYKINGYIHNNHFSLAKIPDTHLAYRKTNIEYDHNGTLPVKRTINSYFCDSISGAEPISYGFPVDYVPAVFRKGQVVSDNLDWSVPYSFFYLKRTAFESEFYNYFLNPDTVLYTKSIFPDNCFQIVEDEKFYIVLEKKDGSILDYCWIELKISENNKLNIYRHAITQ